MPASLSRRRFLAHTGLTLAATPLLASVEPVFVPAADENFSISLFSKHVQFLNYDELARVAVDLGFDGIDLTVRPGGHVEPERVKTDLPKAVEAMRKVGLKPLMMTTAISDPADPVSRNVLETAAKQGIRYYRTAWFQYPASGALPAALTGFRQKISELAKLNAQLGLRGAYQNHAGVNVGASLWEIHELLRDTPPDAMGCQYDIRHATVEGGQSWTTGLRLIAPRINSLDIKDFRWENVDGKAKLVNKPLGEGTVDFTRYFQLVKQYGIRGPISQHFEYDLGGVESGSRTPTIPRETIYAAMQRDLKLLRQMLSQAGLKS